MVDEYRTEMYSSMLTIAIGGIMKTNITITVDSNILTKFDEMRGLIPRSIYLNQMMNDKIEAAAGMNFQEHETSYSPAASNSHLCNKWRDADV